MSYANLNDDHEGSAMVTESDCDTNGVLFRHKVFTKFCTFGFVALGSWDITYIVVRKGAMRLYDAEETFESDPSAFVLEIKLTPQSFNSEISAKDYSKDKFNPIILQCFYLLKDNGMWTPTKQLKIGTSDKGPLRRLMAAILIAKQ